MTGGLGGLPATASAHRVGDGPPATASARRIGDGLPVTVSSQFCHPRTIESV